MTNKYCMNCGTELNEDNKFCPSCGQPVNQDPEVKEPQETESVEPEIEVKPQVEEGLNTEQQVNTNEPKKESKTGIGGCIVAIVIVLIVGFLAVKLIGGIWHVATGFFAPTQVEKFDGDLDDGDLYKNSTTVTNNVMDAYNNPSYSYPKDLVDALLPADYLSQCKLYTIEDASNIADTTVPSYTYLIGVITGKSGSPDNYICEISSIANGGPKIKVFMTDPNLHVNDCIILWGDVVALYSIHHVGYNEGIQYKTFNLEDYGYTITTN